MIKGTIIYTSLKENLRQTIDKGFAFGRCLNRKFVSHLIWGSNVPLSSQIPSIKCSIKATDAK